MENPKSNPLTSENHLLFQGLQFLSSELKSFFDQVLASEIDIFGCSISFSQLRLILLKALYSVMAKLESYIVLKIMVEVIFDVVEVMRDAQNMGIKLSGWIDLSGISSWKRSVTSSYKRSTC